MSGKENTERQTVIDDENQEKRRWLAKTLFLILLLLGAIFLNCAVGTVPMTLQQVLDCLMGRSDDQLLVDILFKIRLPRLVAATFLGGALSLSGYLLQTFFNNPIAGPFILGISSGAKLAVALLLVSLAGTTTLLTSFGLIGTAFIGALMSMGIVVLLAHQVKSASILIVCGVMMGYVGSAITDVLLTFADDASIANLRNWQMGSFSGLSWSQVRVLVPVIVVDTLLVFALSKPLSAYRLGEAYAFSMGVKVRAFQVILVLLSSLLAATVTAFAGPVSFVGIACPHLIHAYFKSSRPTLMIPNGFLGGAVFCLFCDWLARTLTPPTELSISAVTALFGAPVVVVMMLKRRKGGSLS